MPATTVTLASPNVLNYYVGKGIVSIQFLNDAFESGDPDYIDIGNVTSLEFTPKVTKLDHWSSRTGTRKKDRVVATAVEAELKFVAEEWTARNLQMALLASLESPSGTIQTLDLLTRPLRACKLKFVGTNDVGPKWNFEFLNVTLTPSAALNPISDEWGKIELTADCLADPTTGVFGTAFADFPA